jgi:EAL domain-containing protein (putative c-di-GMP-specific phosphodiesterase class I)
MQQDDLVTQILTTLNHYGLEPRRFTCEITETAAMSEIRGTNNSLEEMFQAGLHVSIDDFGTGYTSLAALRGMPAAELKIDMAFVKDLENSGEARFITKSIIDMAKRLDLHVVAEGVETVVQSDILVGYGVAMNFKGICFHYRYLQTRCFQWSITVLMQVLPSFETLCLQLTSIQSIVQFDSVLNLHMIRCPRSN